MRQFAVTLYDTFKPLVVCVTRGHSFVQWQEATESGPEVRVCCSRCGIFVRGDS